MPILGILGHVMVNQRHQKLGKNVNFCVENLRIRFQLKILLDVES